jgi:hypothetical protein
MRLAFPTEEPDQLLRAGPRREPDLDLVHDDAGELRQHVDLRLGPGARPLVDDAKAAETVPFRSGQRNSGVGGHVQLDDGGQLAHRRVAPRVLDDEGLPACEGMLAEGVRERRLPPARPRLGQTARALEELPVGIDQRNQRDGNRKDAGGETGDAVERLFGFTVEKIRLS